MLHQTSVKPLIRRYKNLGKGFKSVLLLLSQQKNMFFLKT